MNGHDVDNVYILSFYNVFAHTRCQLDTLVFET